MVVRVIYDQNSRFLWIQNVQTECSSITASHLRGMFEPREEIGVDKRLQGARLLLLRFDSECLFDFDFILAAFICART